MRLFLKNWWEENGVWVLLAWCAILTGWLATLTTCVVENVK